MRTWRDSQGGETCLSHLSCPTPSGLLGPDACPHVASGRMSATNVIYDSADRQRLLVMVAAGETRRTVDAALAYELSTLGDRDLLVALPATDHDGAVPKVALPTMLRAA